MSRINDGTKFTCNLADILNAQFGAKTAQGNPLGGWYRSVWPRGRPFLVNRNERQKGEAIVWFPIVTNSSDASEVSDLQHIEWLNVVSPDKNVIITKYVGTAPQHEIDIEVAPYIGKNHIVFARWLGYNRPIEFFGIYTSERQGDTLVYKRIADTIETSDWQR